MRELWVVLYLHNWDPVNPVTNVQPIYPEVSGIYDTWQEAETARLASTHPHLHWVRRGHIKSAQA